MTIINLYVSYNKRYSLYFLVLFLQRAHRPITNTFQYVATSNGIFIQLNYSKSMRTKCLGQGHKKTGDETPNRLFERTVSFSVIRSLT